MCQRGPFSGYVGWNHMVLPLLTFPGSSVLNVPSHGVHSDSIGQTLPKPAKVEATKKQENLELGTKSQSNCFTV